MRGPSSLLGLSLLIAPLAIADAQGQGRVVRVEHARSKVVRIPGGVFTMGIADARLPEIDAACRANFPDEPVLQGVPIGCDDYGTTLAHMAAREVYLTGYSIDRDEVRVDEYRRCVEAGQCPLDPLVSGDDRYIRDVWPMVNITWDEAGLYCRWRGGRLPTEAEWEHAARDGGGLGDESRIYPWGNTEFPHDFNHGQARAEVMRDLDRTKNLSSRPPYLPIQFMGDPDAGDGAEILATPGSYTWGASAYGTRDQAGNVAEWTADAFVATENERGYDNLSSFDPFREGTIGSARVVRGGSWRQPSFLSRSDIRDPFNAIYVSNRRFSHVGFRCAYSPHPLSDVPPPPAGKRIIDI